MSADESTLTLEFFEDTPEDAVDAIAMAIARSGYSVQRVAGTRSLSVTGTSDQMLALAEVIADLAKRRAILDAASSLN